MRNKAKWVIQLTSIGLFLLIIIGYSFLKTKDLIIGTSIDVSTPREGQVFDTPIVKVAGKAKHVNILTLDGRKITTDPDGNFSTELIVGTGYNILELAAIDTFNRPLKKIINVSYKASSTIN